MSVINHCGMTDAIESKLSKEDFMEAVMERSAAIVESEIAGSGSQPHELAGVELVAQVVAQAVKLEGARKVADDVGADLARLINQAKSEHISSC
ncbi:MAG: hypothetical protein Q7K65_04345 [Candidatus Buchananbacteria bacterium]|nr:hypothetical protein [Candidatus Buchananbacteria bacterium]